MAKNKSQLSTSILNGKYVATTYDVRNSCS